MTKPKQKKDNGENIPFVPPIFEDRIPIIRVRSYLCIDICRERTYNDDE